MDSRRDEINMVCNGGWHGVRVASDMRFSGVVLKDGIGGSEERFRFQDRHVNQEGLNRITIHFGQIKDEGKTRSSRTPFDL